MKKALTPSEAINAIYLDFEGAGPSPKNMDTKKLPHLAGIYRPKQNDSKAIYKCICFKEDWSPIAKGDHRAVISDFVSFFQRLADTVEKSKARIIYWSEHEEKVLKQFLQNENREIHERLIPQLTNLKLVAKDYYASRKRLVARKNLEYKKLDDCFSAMYPKRKPFKTLSISVPESCKRIDNACAKHKRWKTFSKKQRIYVDELIEYNQGDCQKMWLIAKKIGNFYKSSNG